MNVPTNPLSVTVYDMHDGHCFAPLFNFHTFLSDSYAIPRVPLTGANTGFRKGVCVGGGGGGCPGTLRTHATFVSLFMKFGAPSLPGPYSSAPYLIM